MYRQGTENRFEWKTENLNKKNRNLSKLSRGQFMDMFSFFIHTITNWNHLSVDQVKAPPPPLQKTLMIATTSTLKFERTLPSSYLNWRLGPVLRHEIKIRMATSKNCAPMCSRLLYLLTNFHFQLNQLSSFVKWPSFSVKSMSLFGVVLQFCFYLFLKTSHTNEVYVSRRLFTSPNNLTKLATIYRWYPLQFFVAAAVVELFATVYNSSNQLFHFPNIPFLSVETWHKSL